MLFSFFSYLWTIISVLLSFLLFSHHPTANIYFNPLIYRKFIPAALIFFCSFLWIYIWWGFYEKGLEESCTEAVLLLLELSSWWGSCPGPPPELSHNGITGTSIPDHGPAGTEQNSAQQVTWGLTTPASSLWACLKITELGLSLVMVSEPGPEPDSLICVPALSADWPYPNRLSFPNYIHCKIMRDGWKYR